MLALAGVDAAVAVWSADLARCLAWALIPGDAGRGRPRRRGPAGGFVTGRWTPTEDTAVRLADPLDYEHGGRRLVELTEWLGRTEAAVRQRASKLRVARLQDRDG